MKLGERLGENEWKILAQVFEKPAITMKELSDSIGISTTAIENNITKLKNRGFLIRKGSDREGYWEIVSIEENVFEKNIPILSDSNQNYGENPTGQFEKNWENLQRRLGEKLGERLGERLGENEWKILAQVFEKPAITMKELSDSIGISTTAIENNITKLKNRGFLIRKGSDREGYWEIVVEF